MKRYILIGLSTLGLLAPKVWASECKYREVPSAGKTYVLPVYKANGNFFFDKEEKSAFAQVTWGIDEEATRHCFNEGKERFPQAKLFIPTVKMDDLTLSVLGGASSTNIEVSQQANGHWFGMADNIKIPYSLKKEIAAAINAGEKVISITGDLKYRITEIEKKNVAKIECTLRNEEAGIINLYKRMGEIKSFLERSYPSEGINNEEVMQVFLGTCVKFVNVDSEGLAGFDSAQRINSKMIRGTINIEGNLAKETTETMPAVSVQNSTVFDI